MANNYDESYDSSVQLPQNSRDKNINTIEGSALITSDGVNSGDITLRSRYVYSGARFTNLFKFFIVIDSLLTITLWLTGGYSNYFINSVTHFNIYTSIFDLVVIWFLKIPFYVRIIDLAEAAMIKSFNITFNSVLQNRMRSLFWKLYMLSLVLFLYALVKGSLVLRELIGNPNYEGMHDTFYACCIWCVVSSFTVFVLSLLSSRLMRKMKIDRTIKYYNQNGHEVDKDGKRIPSKASLVRLFSLAKPETGLLCMGFFMLLLSSGVQTVAPLFFGKVVDAALKSMDELTHTVCILLGIYGVGSVASLFRSWVFTLAGQRLVARLRNQLFGSVILQDVAFFDMNRTGELCNRLSSDTQVLQNAITVNMSMLFRYALQIIGSLALMFYLNPSLTGVLLAVVPVVSLTAVQYGKFVRKMRKRFQDKLADAGTKAEEALSSVRTVKSFSGEMRENSEYGINIEESYQIGKKLAMAQGFMDGLFSFLAYGAIGAVLFYGGKLVNENMHDSSKGITAGLLTSFLLYTLQVAMAFAILSSLYGDFMQAVGASVRIFTLLDRVPDLYTPSDPVVLPYLTGELEFKNVGFNYPSRPESQVLKDISFKVKPGEMVALVGPSGGGKSTIVNLIERFYDPCEGSISIGGHDLKSLDLTWFRQKISMVSQEPTLFACSIRDNIAYGRGATDEEVIEAAKQANAHEFISGFEEGYSTMVGERGVRLSGGQKQRVAIARALIMNPTLLLLDEATSALDAESEHLVQEAIDRAMNGRTVIVIAHRLSTVRNADKVVVINKGKIAEMGTHTELVSKPTVYRNLVMRQLTAGQQDASNDGGSHKLTNELKLNQNYDSNINNTNDQDVFVQSDRLDFDLDNDEYDFDDFKDVVSSPKDGGHGFEGFKSVDNDEDYRGVNHENKLVEKEKEKNSLKQNQNLHSSSGNVSKEEDVFVDPDRRSDFEFDNSGYDFYTDEFKDVANSPSGDGMDEDFKSINDEDKLLDFN